MKYFSVALLLALGFTTGSLKAQTNRLQNQTTHHIGIQANPLLRQILSLGASDQVTNPYLLRYAIRNPNNQNEFNFGLGLSFLEDVDEDDLKSDNFSIDFRAGYALKRDLGKGFEAGISFDLLFSNQSVKTVSVNNFGGGGVTDSSITRTTSSSIGFGGGPRLTFDYYITPRLKLGTEASLYFTRFNDNQKIVNERFIEDFSGNLEYSRNEDEDQSRLTLTSINLPVAIYLTFVF